MKKILNITGILLLLFAALLGISAFIMSHYIDPNKFKGRISQYVFAKTGQVLVINGNMQWSLFPWIGLKANNLSYYNAPNFTPKVFVSAKEMDIKIKLVPLITGKIEVGNITLDHAVLNLIKNKKGEFNWQSLVKDHEKDENHDNSDTTSKTISKLTIESLKIKNSNLNWYDNQQNSHNTISDLNISSHDIRFGQAFPLAIQFNLLNNRNVKNLYLDIRTDLNLSKNYQKYSFENIKLKGEYYTPQESLNLKAQGYVSCDKQAQTMETKLSLAFDDINAELALSGKSINKKMQINGTVSTEEFSLKNLLRDLGSPMDTKNSKSLKSVTLISKVNFNDDNLKFEQLHASIDQNDLYGHIVITMQPKLVQFNITTNNVDVDDYLSAGKDNATSQSKSSAEKNKNNKQRDSDWKLNGNIKIANLKMDKLKLSQVTATINKKNNNTTIAPLRAIVYKGEMNGSITINQQPHRTAVYIKQSINHLNIRELLSEFSEADKLTGTTNINADLVSIFNENTSFLSALNGKIQFSLLNGSLRGVDVIYQLSRAHAFLKHLPTSGITDSKQTEFSSLTANAVVNNGVINADNLTLTSIYLKVNGKGSTNLVTKDIHYRLNALAQPKLAAENNQIGKEVTIYQVPIKISGKLTKPSVNLDFVELAKNIVAKEIQKPVAEHLGKNINKLKDNLKEQIQDKLKAISPLSLLSKFKKSDDNAKETPVVEANSTDMSQNAQEQTN